MKTAVRKKKGNERQTDRQTETQRERETETQRERDREGETGRQTDRETEAAGWNDDINVPSTATALLSMNHTFHTERGREGGMMKEREREEERKKERKTETERER